MNNNNNLKAYMFDLMDDKRGLEKRVGELTEGIEEREETIEELRGQIRIVANLADRRAEMIRELSKENIQLKAEQRQGKLPQSFVESVRKQAFEEAITVIKEQLINPEEWRSF